MKEGVFTEYHRVLKSAERRQPRGDEMVKHEKRLLAIDRPLKVRPIKDPKMISQPGIHQFNHCFSDRVQRPLWRIGCGTLIQRLAIIMIKIPLTTNGVTSVHQDPSRLPDFTVEVFHPRLLPAR